MFSMFLKFRNKYHVIENAGTMHVGDNFFVHRGPVPSLLKTYVGGSIVFLDDCCMGHASMIVARKMIRIGHRVRIGSYVSILDCDDDVVPDLDSEREAKPILIEDDVVMGSRVTIYKGSMIGAGSVILDGAVVFGDVPANSYVEGNPACVFPMGRERLGLSCVQA